ncbi:unnamed protein product, partial [Effrenium voratum]
MTFRCVEDYMWLPAFGEEEKNWPNGLRIFLYVLGLFYCFLGVAVVSDIFMNAIERITSQKKRVRMKSGKIVTQTVWNDTMANLTLMALGSSAPEILLSIIEIMSNEMYIGDLGSGTVVGSAAFNLLIISAVCVCSIPDGEVRYIKETGVYAITASFSIFAYVWLLFILMVFSPDICEVWEGVVTFLLFPLLLVLAFAADKGWFSSQKEEEPEPGFHGAIPPDVTKEELAEIEQGIREEYNHKISDDQLVRVIQHMYQGKPSRAFYRHAAMAGLGGRKQALNDVGLGVKVKSREGSAKANSDFIPVDEVVTFTPGETLKDYFVEIVDDAAYEEDEEFYLDLSDPKLLDQSSDQKVRLRAGLGTVTVVIVDDDEPGKLRFQQEQVEVKEMQEDTTLSLVVERFNGATGAIECRYYTEDHTAIAGYDYEEAAGTLSFEHTVQTATIEIVIKPKGRYENTSSFNVFLVEPAGGAVFDKNTDGGAASCICHVVIKACDEKKAALDRIASRINWNKHALGYLNWKEQFRDAIFMSNDDDEDGEGEHSVIDMVLHFLSMPWKLLFAFIPPVDYCNGWVCFFFALGMIAVMTAVVGDLANLVGCTLNIGPEITAITFVALGTSLPDTFASKTAAVMDPYADASIGNVTGSNSVNVFLGLGMPWTVAAIYWQAMGTGPSFDQWLSKLQPDGVYSSVRSSVEAFNNLQSPVFVTPAGSLWFNLLVFSSNAICKRGISGIPVVRVYRRFIYLGLRPDMSPEKRPQESNWLIFFGATEAERRIKRPRDERSESAEERTTLPRLAKSAPPRGVQVERRYNLKPSESELMRLLVVRESATSRVLCRFLSEHSDTNSALYSLCRSSRLDVQDFLQEKRPYVTEGIVRIQEGYGDNKEVSVSPEAVHALLGKELSTEQRLKLSSTVIDAVIKGDEPEEAARDAGRVRSVGSEAENEPEPVEESLAASESLQPEDETELLQLPYKDSLDYLNDQFSLLECEIRIAEHRRQSTKEDVGVEEPFLLRSRKINVFEHEAKRKLALARIHHRLKLTKEAGLEIPRLETLLQKTKLDDFERSVVVMLVGNTLSPKIQATLNVGERRFCVNVPLQVRVILETFCRDFKEEVQKRVYFYKSARLASAGIIRIGAGARSGDLTGHTVHIDRRILDFVVGLDTEINEVVEGSNLYKPTATLEQLVLPEEMKQGILALVDNFEQFCKYRTSSGLDDVIAHGSGLVLMFCGPSGTGKTLMVNALAAHLRKRVLLVNFKTLYSQSHDAGAPEEDGSNVLKLFREA